MSEWMKKCTLLALKFCENRCVIAALASEVMESEGGGDCAKTKCLMAVLDMSVPMVS